MTTDTNKSLRGYAKGVRYGHAGGHLRDPLDEALELEYEGKNWWEHFKTKDAALKHIGKLWHCTDIMPSRYSDVLREYNEKFRFLGFTYAQVVRVLRDHLVD